MKQKWQLVDTNGFWRINKSLRKIFDARSICFHDNPHRDPLGYTIFVLFRCLWDLFWSRRTCLAWSIQVIKQLIPTWRVRDTLSNRRQGRGHPRREKKLVPSVLLTVSISSHWLVWRPVYNLPAIYFSLDLSWQGLRDRSNDSFNNLSAVWIETSLGASGKDTKPYTLPLTQIPRWYFTRQTFHEKTCVCGR